MLTIHPPAFIETEGECTGIRYTRGQPSRENGGVLMSDIQNKYITEFELPYRNIERYIKEIGNNWNRLDNNQRLSIKKAFKEMGMVDKIEEFGNECPIIVLDSNQNIDKNVANFIKYLGTNPKKNSKIFMDTLWISKSDEIGISNDKLDKIKDSIYEWSVDNTYVLHSNWRSGSILGFLLLIIIILLIGLSMTGSDSASNSQFGRSLFGKR